MSMTNAIFIVLFVWFVQVTYDASRTWTNSLNNAVSGPGMCENTSRQSLVLV